MPCLRLGAIRTRVPPCEPLGEFGGGLPKRVEFGFRSGNLVPLGKPSLEGHYGRLEQAEQLVRIGLPDGSTTGWLPLILGGVWHEVVFFTPGYDEGLNGDRSGLTAVGILPAQMTLLDTQP